MSAPRKKVLAISGSTKKNSTNERILTGLGRQYADQLDLELYEGIETLPHFHPDLTDGEVAPAAVRKFREQIDRADGVLICSPEYVFSLPGALKNALEWVVATTVFSDKPTAFVIAAASGQQAFASLDLILTTLMARLTPGSRLLIQGAKGKVDAEGHITHPETARQLREVVASLLASMAEKSTHAP